MYVFLSLLFYPFLAFIFFTFLFAFLVPWLAVEFFQIPFALDSPSAKIVAFLWHPEMVAVIRTWMLTLAGNG